MNQASKKKLANAIEHAELIDIIMHPDKGTMTYILEKPISDVKPSIINVGDFVKVIDMENPRSEYVEAIADLNGRRLYCLGDGTWVFDTTICKYQLQGDVRREYIDKLNEVF